jgi:DNA-binding IclR family transcriptional regulator
MTEPKGVEAVERALGLLECFTPETPTLALADLSRASGLYKSTILRLAVSLQRFGYLVRGEDGRFRLGPAAWRLGAVYREAFELADILRPELHRLAARTGETASCYVREGDRRVCLVREEPDRAIRHAVREGTILPLDKGAAGRVLLAHGGGGTEADRAIRAAGHAVSLGERDPEVASIAVPLLASTGKVDAALALSGLVTRFGEERQPALLAALKEAQARLAPFIVPAPANGR